MIALAEERDKIMNGLICPEGKAFLCYVAITLKYSRPLGFLYFIGR